MKECFKIKFFGQVQGVGFRFTTKQIADKLGLVGSVKNKEDGTVEVIVFSSQEKVQELIQELKNIFQGYITDIEIKKQIQTNYFKDFKIL